MADPAEEGHPRLGVALISDIPAKKVGPHLFNVTAILSLCPFIVHRRILNKLCQSLQESILDSSAELHLDLLLGLREGHAMEGMERVGETMCF